MAQKGWDFFVADPGVANLVQCRVCGEMIPAKKDVMGPTGLASAMAGIKRLHDEFLCIHSKEKWHEQALAIKMLAEQHPSNEISKIMLREAKQIVKGRLPTKSGFA